MKEIAPPAWVLARGMLRALHECKRRVVVAPPLQLTSAAFARDFAGTLSLKPETVTALLVEAVLSLRRLLTRSARTAARAVRDPAVGWT